MDTSASFPHMARLHHPPWSGSCLERWSGRSSGPLSGYLSGPASEWSSVFWSARASDYSSAFLSAPQWSADHQMSEAVISEDIRSMVFQNGGLYASITVIRVC